MKAKLAKPDIIIDATKAILGRLASYCAKQALLGKNIVVVNCNEIIITGRPRTTINEYKEMRQKGGSSLKGPFFPKHPERIVKRTVRGMLSYKQVRGKEALKRVICYNDVPEQYKDSKKISAGKPKNTRTIKLKELSRDI